MKIKNDLDKEIASAKEKDNKKYVKLKDRENEIREELVNLGASPSKRKQDLLLELQLVIQKMYDLEKETPKEIDQIKQKFNITLDRQRQNYEDKIVQLENEEQELKRKMGD